MFAIFIVKSYGYIASLFSMIRYMLTCSWQKSTVYDVLHQRVIITWLCYSVKQWTDPSCSKTWHNLYRMNTPHLHVGYVLCWYTPLQGREGGTQYRYFLFVFFSPYLAYECEHWLMGGSGVNDVQGHPRADLQVFRQPPSQIVSLLP